MEHYITNPHELERLIDGIPVPDITVSSISQQSARLTPQSKPSKVGSLTSQQIQQIVEWSKSNVKHHGGNLFPQVIAPSIEMSQQNTVKNQKTYTLGTFNGKENDGGRVVQELKQAQERDIMKHNSKLRGQLIDQQKVIESQMNQIAQMNDKIEELINETNGKHEQLNQQLLAYDELIQQQQSNDEIKIELQVSKRKQQEQQQIISDLHSENEQLQIQLTQAREQLAHYSTLENQCQLLRNDKTNLETLLATQREQLNVQNQQLLHSEVLSGRDTEYIQQIESLRNDLLSARQRTVDPEVLSEDDTLQMLLNLLNRVSKSQRMARLLRRNVDFRQLMHVKRSQPSLNKLPMTQGGDITRKLSFNQEHFKQVIRNAKY